MGCIDRSSPGDNSRIAVRQIGGPAPGWRLQCGWTRMLGACLLNIDRNVFLNGTVSAIH